MLYIDSNIVPQIEPKLIAPESIYLIMKLITQIELNLTISNVVAMYAKDYESMLLQQARDTYQHKCLDNQFILDIHSIEKRSLANVVKRDLDAKTRVYVIVSATVLRFDMYDTICGMKVINIIRKSKISPNDILQLIGNNCHAIVNLNDEMIKPEIGDIIPIKVGTCAMRILHDKVSINAFPFAPHMMDKIAYVVPSMSKYDVSQLNEQLIPLLEAKKNNLQLLNATRRDFMSKLLYPFKAKAKPIGKNKDIFAFVKDIETHEGDIICIDQGVDLLELKITILNSDEAEANEFSVVKDSNLMEKCLMPFIKHLDLISELTIEYADDEMFNKHKYIWDTYEQFRL